MEEEVQSILVHQKNSHQSTIKDFSPHVYEMDSQFVSFEPDLYLSVKVISVLLLSIYFQMFEITYD
jgi:hypothetical protein